MKKTMLIAALAASMAGSAAIAQPVLELRFGFEQPGSFWFNSPKDLHGRIGFLENRVNRLRADGHITAAEFDFDHKELGKIHSEFDGWTAQDRGDLSQDHKLALWHHLTMVSDRLHWQSTYGY